ncbi:MAG: FAD-binding oxidoreductase, partial [Planctomycetota bacterium]
LGLPVAICGGRHAMGGQQFAQDGLLLDMTKFNRVRSLDANAGLVEAEAGIFWPKLLTRLDELQDGVEVPWSIRQKQTGVDDVSLGGSLAANIHGRGLRMRPFVDDIESFTLMNASGEVLRCSRTENADLFRLAIGGYGCFGIVLTVTLRLQRRQTLERRVEAICVADLLTLIEKRLADGAIYGDCQYATHYEDTPETHRGILSTYHPVAGPADAPAAGLQLNADDWSKLYRLGRSDKRKAFEVYTAYYLKTNGRRYASDRHQLSPVFSGYLAAIDAAADDAEPRGTEMISEFYCDPDRLLDLLASVRAEFDARGVDMTYGTIRFIEPDEETLLRWAKRRSVCVVVNLHVKHHASGVDRVKDHFRRLFDLVIAHDGRFYLTYHRWATRDHLDAAYPEMPDFLRAKHAFDPDERFASDWYRHVKSLYPEVS